MGRRRNGVLCVEWLAAQSTAASKANGGTGGATLCALGIAHSTASRLYFASFLVLITPALYENIGENNNENEIWRQQYRKTRLSGIDA